MSTASRLFSQTSHGLAAKDVVRLNSSGDWVKAQADTQGNLDYGAIVVDAPSADEVEVHVGQGHLELPSHGLGSKGDVLYLSETTPGSTKTTAPSTGYVRELARILGPDLIAWQPVVAQPA